MTIHALHPPIHEYGLADDCPRCAEHAEHPLDSLDLENQRELLRRVNMEWAPRSENEARAMVNLDRAMHERGKLSLLEERS